MQNNVLQYGITANRAQIFLQLIQVFLVGLTVGMTRVVIPGLAEVEFGLGKQAFFLLASFVGVFGLAKAVTNLLAGYLGDRYGRKWALTAGWLVAVPVPFMILFAPSWGWVVGATLLLGVNQGLCWSMTINSKLDLARQDQKGLVNGINEFSGYVAVAAAGVVTAYLVDVMGAREGLFAFGSAVILLGLSLAVFFVRETLPWAEAQQDRVSSHVAPEQKEVKPVGLLRLLVYAGWQSKPLLALNQAGLIEKFVDALIWVFLPVYFLSQGVSLLEGSAIISAYATSWGGLQLVTGPVSDRWGRKPLIVAGMWLCALGVLAIPLTNSVFLWVVESAVVGTGMAMLYPVLGAAVADFSPARQRGTLLGIYRFWRDLGYAVGAVLMGLAAQWTKDLETPFWLTAVAMLLSGALVFLLVPGDKRPPGQASPS